MNRILPGLVVVFLEVVIGCLWLSSHEPEFAVPRPEFAGFSPYTRRKVEDAIAATRVDVAMDLDMLADTLFAAGFYPEAEVCYRQATIVQPQRPQFHYNLGFCLSSIGDLDGSSEAFQQAIQSGHSRPDACWYFIGMNALRAGDAAVARRAFDKSPLLPASQIELAQLNLNKGRFDESRPLLAGLLQSNPNGKRCHQLMARLADHDEDRQLESQSHALADVLFEPVFGPWHARAQKMQELFLELGSTNQVTELRKKTQSKSAFASLQQEVDDDNSELWDPILEDFLSDIALAMGSPEEQIVRLRNVIHRDGLNSYRAARLGFALLAQGQNQEAMELFQFGIPLAVSREDNGVVDMARTLAQMYTEANDQDLANRYEAIAEFHSGLALMDQLRVPEAKVAFEKATQCDSLSDRYWFWLGRSSQMLGDFQEAGRAFDKCLETNPHHERAQVQRSALPEKDRTSGDASR